MKSLTLYRCKWELRDLRETLFEHAVNLEHFCIVFGIIPRSQITRGRKVTILELGVILHSDPSDFPVLRHMKSIDLQMNMMDSKSNPRPYVGQFLTELLESCPNLEELNVDNSAWYDRTWATDFIATNDSIKLSNLKVLRHLIDPDCAKILNLQMKQLPLTTLHIRIRFKDVTLEALHELFRSLKHTLTNLQLIFLEYACAREFPSSLDLYKLRSLELWKFKGELGFLKDFVDLKELTIGEMELKGQSLFNNRTVFPLLLPNVSKFTFKDYWESRVFS